jgi:hypothetical protein
MVFTSPTVLWALSLLLLPLIIHLFQFRRFKKLYFSDVSLLKEIKTSSQTKHRVRHLLILLTRMAFVAALVIAFAEPMLPSKDTASDVPERISIYVDNSFSMQAADGADNLLQRAQQSAFEIAASYPKGTPIQLITNAFTAREKRFLDLDGFVSQLDEVSSSPHHRDVQDVVAFADQSSAGLEGKHALYFISDFSHTLDSADIDPDSNRAITLLPLFAEQRQNVSIDTVWLESPLCQKGVEQLLHIEVVNYGKAPVENLELELLIAGRSHAKLSLRLDVEERLDTTIAFIPEQASYLTGLVRIEDFPVTFDNAYHFALHVTDRIPISEVGGTQTSSSPFAALFHSDAFAYKAFAQDALTQDLGSREALLILHGLQSISSGLESVITTQLEAGGNVLVVLPASMSESMRNTLLDAFDLKIGAWDTSAQTVSQINLRHRLFQDVFEHVEENVSLPMVKGHYNLDQASYDEEVLRLMNGSPLLASKSVGNGQLFLLTAPLESTWTNLHRHALFVPLMINMAAHAGIGTPLAYSLTRPLVKTDVRIEQAIMRSLSDSTSFIPGMSYNGLIIGNQVTQPGPYGLFQSDSLQGVYAFNHDRRESAMMPANEAQLEAFFQARGIAPIMFESNSTDVSLEVLEASLGTKLWPLFVLIALALIILETALLKFTRT